MSLREHLFDDPGYTGKNDSNGKKIFAGNTLRDHNGIEVIVYEMSPGRYQVATDIYGANSGPTLNLWLSMAHHIEVVDDSQDKQKEFTQRN